LQVVLDEPSFPPGAEVVGVPDAVPPDDPAFPPPGAVVADEPPEPLPVSPGAAPFDPPPGVPPCPEMTDVPCTAGGAGAAVTGGAVGGGAVGGGAHPATEQNDEYGGDWPVPKRQPSTSPSCTTVEPAPEPEYVHPAEPAGERKYAQYRASSSVPRQFPDDASWPTPNNWQIAEPCPL